MTSAMLESENAAVPQAQTQRVPEGFSGPVVPSDEFGNVVFDPGFTGAASRGADSPYFSQLDNLQNEALLYGQYAPEPVRGRVLLVIVDAVYTVGGWPVSAAAVEPAETVAELITAEPVSGALSLAEATEQMRHLVDLPVVDLARMCGLGRRQYYNLLRGKVTTMKTPQAEQHIRLMHSYLQEMNGVFDGDVSKVRSALLMPLEAYGHASFLDIASAGDPGRTQTAYAALSAELPAAEKLPERLPPSGTQVASDHSWQDAAAYMDADKRGR
jgi:hypothetical protein